MLYDAESGLYQTLLNVDFLPGRHLISNISQIRKGTRQVKCFFGPTFYEELFGAYHLGQF